VSLRAAGLLLLFLGASAGTLAATPASTKEKELRELRGRIEALQKGLAGAEESHGEAADALKDSERAISDANRALRELGQQSRAINRRLAALRAESREHEATLKSQQARLGRLLYRQYVAGEAEPLKLLLNGEDPARIARDLHYFGYVSRARVELIAGVRANLARLDALEREAAQQSAELAAVTREQRAQRGRLERERRARNQVLASLSRDIRRQRHEIRTLKRDEQRLTRLIEQLARLVARERPGPRLRNERLPDASVDGTPFPALKGRLSLPVRGDVEGEFGSPRAGGGTLWKGVFIAARSGEGVKAVAGGRVVFADWLRGFGNLMIIDHGSAYMTLYANNEALYKRVGDPVRSGETIATVGNSGGNPDSGLYFELRHEGKALDPLGWVDVR
jgi:septal ring factor EnvC (AmiA/AmiB activator)